MKERRDSEGEDPRSEKGLAGWSEGWLGRQACGFCWQPSTQQLRILESDAGSDRALRAVTTGQEQELSPSWVPPGESAGPSTVWAGGAAGRVKQGRAVSPSAWHSREFLGQGGYLGHFLMEYLSVLAITGVPRGGGRKGNVPKCLP